MGYHQRLQGCWERGLSEYDRSQTDLAWTLECAVEIVVLRHIWCFGFLNLIPAVSVSGVCAPFLELQRHKQVFCNPVFQLVNMANAPLYPVSIRTCLYLVFLVLVSSYVNRNSSGRS